MQPIRSQMRVTPRHCPLVPEKIRNVFKRRPFHPQPAGKRMPQVMSMKVFEARLNDRVIKPMPHIFERFARLARPKNAPSSTATLEDCFQSRQRRIV